MDNESVFWKIAIPVLIALLAGSTSPWWWEAFFDKSPVVEAPDPDLPVSPVPDPAPEPTSEPTSEPAIPPVSERASITIAYTGDYFGCRLPVEISIGDQSLYPAGNGYVFAYNDVELGQQPYQIEGQIQCPSIEFVKHSVMAL